MSSTNEFVAEQRLRILSLCRKFKDTEKHFCYIHAEILLLDRLLSDGDLKTGLIKKLVTDVLKHFGSMEAYQSDLRMLVLWKLLGQYSVEMKMEGVMERLDELGHFSTAPEFYIIWTEHWAGQKNLERVNEIIAKCIAKCKGINPTELFRPIVDKYFGQKCEVPALVPEKDSPYAKRMRRVELSFNEESLLGDLSNCSPKKTSTVGDRLKLQEVKNKMQFPKKNVSKSEFDEMLDDDEMTLAGAHGKFAHSRISSTPRRSVAPGFHLLSPEQISFQSPANIDNSLRGLSEAMKGQGGTNLQRRLSMSKQCKASDLVGALPRLTIKTPVPEENSTDLQNEQNKENEGLQPRNAGEQAHKKHVILDENVVQKKIVASNVCTNPWDEKERQEILKCINVLSLTQCHDFRENVCPKVDIGRTVDLGGENFSIMKLLGQGGFAKVFQAVNDESKSYAIKWEQPACPWEVYICDALQCRLPKPYVPFVMNVRDAYIFSNSSVIVYDFYPCGTLLDLNNYYKKEGNEMSGLLVTFLGVQLGRILEQVHAAKIIHADIKPDNIVIAAPIGLNNAESVKDLFRTPVIKLIDWGRSIDLHFTPDRQFFGRAGTKCFDCIEMIYNRPWTYQTDFFGFVATIHVMIFNDYLLTTRENDKFRPVKQIKRRFALRSIWLNIFEKFLNIPDCKSLPSWNEFNTLMETELIQGVDDEPQEWRKAVERFNASIRNISNA